MALASRVCRLLFSLKCEGKREKTLFSLAVAFFLGRFFIGREKIEFTILAFAFPFERK
jgi:hypothetical protein